MTLDEKRQVVERLAHAKKELMHAYTISQNCAGSRLVLALDKLCAKVETLENRVSKEIFK